MSTAIKQGELFNARATDPATSKEAGAAAAEKLRTSQRDVLDVLRGAGPLSDEYLVARYLGLAEAGVVSAQSESGIRTRRAELAKAGKVVLALVHKNARGRRVQIWRAL